jgi:arginase
VLGPGDHELGLLEEYGIVHLHADEIHDDVVASAERARGAIEAPRVPFVVHCDVDVLSFVDVPLADVPDSGGDPGGLRLDELMAA